MSKSKDSKPAKEQPPKPTLFESIRETFDSIAIAFILAFLFRSFQAEAFVIPTGSMALTLMGAHKEVDCPQCHTLYRVGASEEFPEDRKTTAKPVVASTCPNCRFRYQYADPKPPTYNGDRILVTKFPYEFADPERFDVAVFKNPGMARQNYIKRIIGLPNEEILVYRGDIYARGAGATSYSIARKDPKKIVSTLQTVYDNDRVLPSIIARGWPERWGQMQTDGTTVDPQSLTWQASADKKSFHAVGKPTSETWLRYQHIVPDRRAWDRLVDRALTAEEIREFCKPQLIADYCEYNSDEKLGEHRIDNDPTFVGLHWVSDLALECELDFTSWTDDQSEVILELVEGGKAFQCRIKPASGDVELRIEGADGYRPKAAGKVAGKGAHKLRFANIDDHLVLWVNDKPVAFDAPTNFLATRTAPVIELDPHTRDTVRIGKELAGDTKWPALEVSVPKEQDLRSPVGIATRGVEMFAAHLHIKRDLYYVADKSFRLQNAPSGWINIDGDHQVVNDYRGNAFEAFDNRTESTSAVIRKFMSDVKTDLGRWSKLTAVTFQLEADQFFVMGDNSPKSLDGRLWEGQSRTPSEHYVKRELLIGKALFVYWPHGVETVPGTDVGLPNMPWLKNQYGPNFKAMRLIR